jgi:hypothetical protein
MSSVVRQLLPTTTIRAGVDLGRRARDGAGPARKAGTHDDRHGNVLPKRCGGRSFRGGCCCEPRVPPGSDFGAALVLLEAGESEALIFTKVDRASPLHIHA